MQYQCKTVKSKKYLNDKHRDTHVRGIPTAFKRAIVIRDVYFIIARIFYFPAWQLFHMLDELHLYFAEMLLCNNIQTGCYVIIV